MSTPTQTRAAYHTIHLYKGNQIMAKSSSKAAALSKSEAAARVKADKQAVGKAKAAPRKVTSTVGAPAFAVGQGCRPVAGVRLYAYTAAWLSMFSLDAGKSAPRAAVVKVAGSTAVAYHIRNGNMIQTAAGLELTPKGKSVFGARAIDEEIKAGFMSVFKSGEPNKIAQVNKTQIVAVAA